MVICRICGKISKDRECKQCAYFLKHGTTKETIKAMYADDETNKIWKENIQCGRELAEAYYDSLIENYPQSQVKKSSKEEFGFNTFADGIRMGLDIALPMLDQKTLNRVKEKIKEMVVLRKKINSKLKRK